MKVNLSINQALHHSSGVGCVYPKDRQSYFVNSNIQNTICVECTDGYFYATKYYDTLEEKFNLSVEQAKDIIDNHNPKHRYNKRYKDAAWFLEFKEMEEE